MKVVARSGDGRYIVTSSDTTGPVREDEPAVIVDAVHGTASPVLLVGSITAHAEAGDWIEDTGDVPAAVLEIARRAFAAE